MANMPIWWDANTAAGVEAFITANAGVCPNVNLMHGTEVAFFTTVTGWNRNEQAWIDTFFQRQQGGGNAYAGPGLYVTTSLQEAQAYAAQAAAAIANRRIMKIIGTTLNNIRYLDLTSRAVRNAYGAMNLPVQNILGHAYKCILRYTPEYYVVKDCRVEFEPN